MRRLSWWAQCNHKGPYKKGVRKVRGRRKRWDSGSRGWDDCIEDGGRGLWAKEFWQLLEAGKKETLPWNLQKGYSPASNAGTTVVLPPGCPKWGMMVLLLFQVWSPESWSLAGLGRYCYCSRLRPRLPHVSGGDQDDTSAAVNMAADFAVWSGASATPALGLGRRIGPWHLWPLL